jgi:hypothetical protein
MAQLIEFEITLPVHCRFYSRTSQVTRVRATFNSIITLTTIFRGNKGAYFHLLYNVIDLKNDWNTFIPSEDTTITPFGTVVSGTKGSIIDYNEFSRATKSQDL